MKPVKFNQKAKGFIYNNLRVLTNHCNIHDLGFRTKEMSIIFVILLWLSNCVYAQTELTNAQATFIYNFTRLIEWPNQQNNSKFIIGVYGSSELCNELSKYTKDKLVGTQQIVVRNLNNTENIKDCNLLFVSYDKSVKLKELTALLINSNTLIVTEKEGTLNQGSAINFIINDDKLSYEIRPANATKFGLKLSTLIIKYAKNTNS